MLRKIFALPLLLVLIALSSTAPAFAQKTVDNRLAASTIVLREILNIPADIPRDLLNRAYCVIVFPSVKKAAFVVGGSYGRGVITCRTGANYEGPWSAPAMFALEGLSFGFQIGGQATDFVLLVMNEGGAKSVMTSKVKLGADASISAGPVGRTAEASTDIALNAQILSYSRSRGVFAGISLAGSTLRSDNDANRALYGKDLSANDIVHDRKVRTPVGGRALIALLNRVSPHRKK